MCSDLIPVYMFLSRQNLKKKKKKKKTVDNKLNYYMYTIYKIFHFIDV